MSRRRSAFIGVLSLIAAFPGRAGGHFQPGPSGVAAGVARTAHADDSSGVVTGVMSDTDAGHPVPYGTVAIVGTERAVFADAEGRFRLGGLASGTYMVRARQIGYAPKDTVVQVAPAPAVTVVTFHMRRIPALLKVVKVEGRRSGRCVFTGIPDSTADLPLARIFTQVGENVDRFRLLADEYPYHYRRVERNILRSDPGGDSLMSADTVSYESRAKRRYKVGGVIYSDVDDRGRTKEYMYLPTFRDLSDASFLAAHCFSFRGTQSLGGSRVWKVDFRPDDQIRVPDVEGSIYLDSTRLIVRRAVFRMTKPEAAKTPIQGLSVTATYREVAPLIPVVDSLITDQPLGSAGESFSRQPIKRTAIEEARILDYVFEPRVADGSPVALGGVVRDTAHTARDTAPARAELAGRVLQSDGIPVGHAEVGLLGTTDSTETDRDGHFVLRVTTPGTYMVSVRGLGLKPKRFVATVGKVRGADVVVSMDRIVPVLATVTTTTNASAANGTGFDRRKTMGNGQFLTYDQIASKQVTSITQLLQGMTGTSVMPSSLMPGSAASGTRGPGSCVSYVVDGVPQLQLMEHTVDGGVIAGESPDNLIDISNVGALEVYSASERPAEFQSMQEHPMQPGTPPPRVGIDRQQCALVVVWTKGKAGVLGGGGSRGAGGAPAKSVVGADDATHVDAVFGTDSACVVPPVPSKTVLPVYATILGAQSRPVPGGLAWPAYVALVLGAVHRWTLLPTELRLPSFGVVGTRTHQTRDVSPMLSSEIAFTIDSLGVLADAGIVASSLSGAADSSILVMLAQASAAHDLPAHPPGGGATRLRLVVSTAEPPFEMQGVTIGYLAVPVWHLTRGARLAAKPKRAVSPAADSVTIAAVVDAQGRVSMPTVRTIRGTASLMTGADSTAFGARLEQTLEALRFEPAQIAGCAIPELVQQSIAVPRVLP